ncbi:hypothetical protein C1646_773437 [Rhizophagus diaphanus]|nr:hypothetical protein C1646_773437 [Rhizophagus diaphanus] [Rhizophagus sp. MUCL 43196]
MSKYLTPHILSAVHFEIAQYLYFIASKVESNIIEMDVSKDKYDSKQTLLKSMIAEVSKERMIPSQWYVNNQKSKDASETTFFVSQKAMQNFLGITLVPNPLAIFTTVTHILYRAAKKR